MDNYENEYLAHHGIKGQKWGVRRTPEQLGHKTISGEKLKKKAKAAVGSVKVSGIKAGKAAGKFIKDQYDKNKEKKKEALIEELSEHPGRMYKHRKELSKDDVDTILARSEMKRKLKDIKDSEHKRTMGAIKRISDDTGTVASAMRNTRDAYQNTALLYNGILDVVEGLSKSSKKYPRLPLMKSAGPVVLTSKPKT